MKRLLFLLAIFTKFSAGYADTITTFEFYLNDSLIQTSIGFEEKDTIKLIFTKNTELRIRVKFGCITSQYVAAFLCRDSLPKPGKKFDWVTRNSRNGTSPFIDLYLYNHMAKENKLEGSYKFYYALHEDKDLTLAFMIDIGYEKN